MTKIGYILGNCFVTLIMVFSSMGQTM